MNEHPIEGLMLTAMDSIRDMVDVNTIIGEPIETSNNIIIIPISKVGFGFASGGSEFNTETVNEYTKKDKDEQIHYKLPFGGGSGAGVSISPVAFLVIQNNNVKLMPVCHSSAFDKLLDYVPDLIEKTNSMLNKQMNNKREDQKQQERKLEREIERQRKEASNQTRISENNIDNDNITIETQKQPIRKAQPRKINEPRYEYEYDETEEDS